MGKIAHRILFVDDDALILRGYNRSISEYSDNWEVDFANSGREALIKLGQQPFDVVVTDMHMPGMDGIQLLDEVNQRMPNVMRFVLSGNTSEIQNLKSAHLVHQMLPKPSDMGHVFTVVERACRLRDMLSEPYLVRIITGIKSLPSVPVMYTKLVKELESENSSAQEVGNIISQDAAMTAKILQLVNSAFFGLSENIVSPQRAVTFLGLNTIKALVLGIQIFSEFQGRSTLPLTIDAIWRHSLLVSNLAFIIARNLNLSHKEQEDARVAGILHDVGKLLELKLPDFLRRARFNRGGQIPVEVEYQLLGTSHAEMGGYLLGIWGLPDSIVEAITFHHRPGLQVVEDVNLMTVLHTADGILSAGQQGKDVPFTSCLDMNYLQKAGIVGRLNDWMATAQDLIGRQMNSADAL